MIGIALPLLLLSGVEIESQHLDVTLDLPTHQATIEAAIRLRGSGPLRLQLTDRADIADLLVDGAPLEHERAPDGTHGIGEVKLSIVEGSRELVLRYFAQLQQDVAEGERPGEIHNFSVDAHVGSDGLFLSDGSAWHPRPLAADGRPALHPMSVNVTPIDGWSVVASGEPTGEAPVDAPRWNWASPRPVDGLALTGNAHVITGRIHETAHGPVEVVMHVTPDNLELAALFVDAACDYLDLYVPRLGAFPYRRFSIVENFFSSGFAYPGFTLLGPQVVGMAPRSLAPGYLDHELVHNWWGNGVYVDPGDGNWCEALTSYCANYWRRVAEQGEQAGRAYRRGTLMKLSSDPAVDDGPLGRFGLDDASPGAPGRFVGYDKGAFVFTMVAEVLGPGAPGNGEPMWDSLRRFAELHLGRRANWNDLQAAFEAQRPDRPEGWLDGFFRFWVREHVVPQTAPGGGSDPATAFVRQIPGDAGQRVDVVFGAGGAWCEIDPGFRVYRALPPGQIVPTIGGTLGKGGCALDADPQRPEIEALRAMIEIDPAGENLLLVGLAAASDRAELIGRTADPIEAEERSFTIAGKTYDGAGQAVLHTMHHPDRPGRFITVFHSNGEPGWARLRLVRFYSRDTTIVWEDGRVTERRVFEPDRRISMGE